MLKNNLKALGIHLFLTLISWIVSVQVFNVANWTTVKPWREHQAQIMRIAYILFIVVIVFYFLFGVALLCNLGRLKENVMSVISIFLIGLLIWGFIIFRFGFSRELITPDKWDMYIIYVTYAFPFTAVNKLNNPISLLMLSLIPSFTMLLGIYAWRKSK